MHPTVTPTALCLDHTVMEAAYKRREDEGRDTAGSSMWEQGRSCHWLLDTPADRAAQPPRADGVPHAGIRKSESIAANCL